MAFKDLPNDSITKTLLVAVGLCLVCSIFVSSAAVFLKPMQETNKLLDKQRNIIQVAGIELAGRSVAEAFGAVEARVVDLQSGEFADHIDPSSYDAREALKDPAKVTALSAAQDIAGIKRRERFATIYLTRDANGNIDKLILPVRGYGLWSTLWGFLALQGDANTVIGLSFYEHAETPGLGGEVDNPSWKAQWPGKEVYGPQRKPQLELVKGGVDATTPNHQHKVDALGGATITSRGVTQLLQFWMGEQGFAPFLTKLQEGRA